MIPKDEHTKTILLGVCGLSADCKGTVRNTEPWRSESAFEWSVSQSGAVDVSMGPSEISMSRLGRVVRCSAGKRKDAGTGFDSPLRLTFLFKNCDLSTLSRNFALHN